MIIYLHGFASSSYSAKAQIFKKYFNLKENFLSPNLPHIPKLATYNIEDLILTFKDKEDIKLIGSSLGGFYAGYFANKYNLKAVLINPAVYPDKTLKQFSGLDCRSYFDGSAFEFTKQHVEDLNLYQIEKYKNMTNFLVCLKTGDEVLDYKLAEQKLKGANFIIDAGGDHSFSDINNHMNKIEDFLQN